MSDDEEYEFEYSDDEEEQMQEDDVAVQVENKYYGSKSLLEVDLDGAANGFLEVLDLEKSHANELAEWGFKATKQLVKVSFRRGQYDKMLSYYGELLRRIKAGAVTRNKAEKTINGILDLVSTASDASHLSSFYDTTLEALAQGSGNERLAFKTRTKQARLYLAHKDWARLRPLLSSLQASCMAAQASPSSSGDMATQLLEVYALQVQMFDALRDNKRTAELVAKAQAVRSAVPHPGIIGVLKEAAGKVAMRERSWESARLAFQESFKAFEEAGNGSRTTANLQYMLLANMLSNNRINPFDDQSSKAHERDPAIAAMVALTEAYLGGDISKFEPVLRAATSNAGPGAGAGSSSSSVHGGLDEFMLGYVNDLLASMRTSVALALVAPYDKVRLAWLGQELGVPATEAEALAAGLILDGRLMGSLDGPAGVLYLGQQYRAAGLVEESKGQGAAAGPAKASGSASAVPAVSSTVAAYRELQGLAERLERLAGTAASMAYGSGGKEGGAGSGGQAMGPMGMFGELFA